MAPPVYTLGHSPDPDDAFMFYALREERIPADGIVFRHILQDIQTLNERASRGELDVTAISFHAYPFVQQHYALLPSGASMGDGYGPMVVAKKFIDRDELSRSRLAIPGEMTSAFLALQLWLEKPARALQCTSVPFDAIIDFVNAGNADAGLLIHEGQLTYGEQGLQCCVDLGQWWSQTHHGLPLPLGGNVIHKRIPPPARSAIARLIKQSIAYALQHREEAVADALQFARGLDTILADKFIGMYVNHWTLDYGERGREAISAFLGEAYKQNLLPRMPELEFVGLN